MCSVHFDFEMCFAPQRRSPFWHRNFQKFHLQMCFAPQQRALFRRRNFQSFLPGVRCLLILPVSFISPTKTIEKLDAWKLWGEKMIIYSGNTVVSFLGILYMYMFERKRRMVITKQTGISKKKKVIATIETLDGCGWYSTPCFCSKTIPLGMMMGHQKCFNQLLASNRRILRNRRAAQKKSHIP